MEQLPEAMKGGLNSRQQAELDALKQTANQEPERKRKPVALGLLVGAIVVAGLAVMGGLWYADYTSPASQRERNVQALMSHMPTVVPIEAMQVHVDSDRTAHVMGNREVEVSIDSTAPLGVEINQDALKKTISFLESFGDTQKIYHLVDSKTLTPDKDGYKIVSLRDKNFPVQVKVNGQSKQETGDIFLFQDLLEQMLFITNEQGQKYAQNDPALRTVTIAFGQAMVARQEGLLYETFTEGKRQSESTYSFLEKDFYNSIPRGLGKILIFKN